MNLYDFRSGSNPLVISIPHAGTWLPDSWKHRLSPLGLQQPDCDWYVDRLYDLPATQHAAMLVANTSRYLVDLNRSASDENLYPGQNTTGLCSTITFSGEPIYLPGQEPSPEEIRQRIADYWTPYHRQIQRALQQTIAAHGYAVLLDAHSIASQVPRLFPGRLPDWNFGTNHGQSCGPQCAEKLQQFAAGIADATWVINGRFVGGYITRNYGNPGVNSCRTSSRSVLSQEDGRQEDGNKVLPGWGSSLTAEECTGNTPLGPIYAFQLELSQATYLDEATGQWDADRAGKTQRLLAHWIDWLLQIEPERS